jgi:hypothetical protein
MPYPSVMACHPRHITHYTEHARSLVKIHALSRYLPDHTRRSNTRNTTVIPLQLLDFFPLHFPIFPLHFPIFPLHFPIFPLHLRIFPFDLVELVPYLSSVYINSATPRTHEVGTREEAFKTKSIPDPSHRAPIEPEFGVIIPWTANDTQGNAHSFNFRADVLDGDHPFLVGCPTLMAMKSTLIFENLTLKATINDMACSFPVKKRANHNFIDHAR